MQVTTFDLAIFSGVIFPLLIGALLFFLCWKIEKYGEKKGQPIIRWLGWGLSLIVTILTIIIIGVGLDFLAGTWSSS